jgi:zeaxanthin glucosyltransferase
MPGVRPLHFGALFSPVPGHLHPIAVLARELQRRGHRVTALNIADVEDACKGQGFDFHAVGTDVMPLGSWERYWTPIATSAGLGAIRATARAHRMITRAMCEGTPVAHATTPFDGLLVDQIQFQGKVIADHLGLPFVTIAPFIPMHRDVDSERPPPYLPFDRAHGRRHRRLANRLGYEVLEVLARPVMKETNEFARRWGVATLRRVADSFSPLLQVTQCPAALDFQDGESGVAYVGNLLDDARPAVDFPYERLDPDRPLVYVSLGTLQNQRPEIYQSLVDALDELPVQGVVSLGRWRDEGEAPIVRSSRHVVVPFAPQKELLERASAVVTHAGMNTVIEALTAGVPLVMVPITNDQPAVAKRVELQGAGIRVSRSKLKGDALRTALRAVLDQPSYRAAASKLQASIRDGGGVTRAADLVEAAFADEVVT